MKIIRNLFACLTLAATFNSVAAFAQAPNLGSTAGFLFFTSAGAVDNTGTSQMTGDAGTNAGDITGLENLNGQTYNTNEITNTAAADLLNAYNELLNTPSDNMHSTTFGNNETIFAGVYYTLGAASIDGNLVLDAQDNPNAVFIFKIGDALTVGSSATISLINGATAANIFWVTEGAVSIGAATNMSGTFLAHNGALGIGDGSVFQGRLLSTGGGIAVSNSQMYIPGSVLLAITAVRFSGKCIGDKLNFNWMAELSEDDVFSIQGSIDGRAWSNLGNGRVTAQNSGLRNYNFSYAPVNNLMVFYRLVQTDISGHKQYGNAIRIEPCGVGSAEHIVLYPNPSTGLFRILGAQRSREVYRASVFNLQGKIVFTFNGIPSSIDLSQQPPGIYEVHIQSKSSSVYQKIVIQGR